RSDPAARAIGDGIPGCELRKPKRAWLVQEVVSSSCIRMPLPCCRGLPARWRPGGRAEDLHLELVGKHAGMTSGDGAWAAAGKCVAGGVCGSLSGTNVDNQR